MSKTDVSTVVKHFPSAQDGYTSTLSSTVIAPAATVPINGGLAGYDDGDVVVFIVDPGNATKEQVVTGTVDTAGSQLTGAKWLRGTNTTHTAGATVVDYWEAAHVKMFTKGLLAAGLTQAGGMGAISPTSVTSTGTITAASFVQTGSGNNTGWNVGLNAPNTVTALGNRSYSCVFNGVDYSTTLSAGMRLRTTRTVAAPTQCTSLNGTTQYYSKTSPAGMTATNNIVASAWVKLTSYPAGAITIIGRRDANNGWDFTMTSSGQIRIEGFNGGLVNSMNVTTYQSIPLNKWVHLAAQLDMSGTATTGNTNSYIMFDGVEVPSLATRAGTNPTSFQQGTGDLNVGALAAGAFWPGKLAQVAIYSAKVTQATMLASMHQTLAGTETSLISAYSFNGVITDLNTTNANNLTANGSAVATNADSPFGGQADGTISSTLDYAIIQKVAFSTNTTVTVQVPEGCTIPTSGGVSSVVYSSNKAPYGMPIQRGKWTIYSTILTQNSVAATGAWQNVVSFQLSIPIGEWVAGYDGLYQANIAATAADAFMTLSTTNNSETDKRFSSGGSNGTTGAAVTITINGTVQKPLSLAAATPYFLLQKVSSGTLYIRGDNGDCSITAENAYL